MDSDKSEPRRIGDLLEDVLNFIASRSRKRPSATKGGSNEPEPQRTGDMLINPGSAAKILELGKDFAAKQIKLGKLSVADVFNCVVPRIGISDLRRPRRIIGGLRGAKV